MMDTEAYRRQLSDLLPPGRAWSRSPTALISRLLEAMAEGMARVHRRALDLVEEADPRTTLELLPDWERVAGLPDPCAGAEQTLEGRRRRLVAQLTTVGGQSPAYLEGRAAALGYDVTITDYAVFTCNSLCDAPMNDEDWIFAFSVNAPATTAEVMTCQSACDDALQTWGNDVLECVINALKPAHTVAIFTYGA